MGDPSIYVKKGGKITADGLYRTDNDGKVQAVTLKSGQGTGADGLDVGLRYFDKVTGSGLNDTVTMLTVADKEFGVMSLGKGYDTLLLTNSEPVDGVTTHRLKLTSVEQIQAAEGDAGSVTLDINGEGTFATDGSVNFVTSGRATSARQTITYKEMVADTTVDLALGKDKIIFQSGTQFTIIDGNLVASHPDELGSVTFLNYRETASHLSIQVVGGKTQTYAKWFHDADTLTYEQTPITLSNIAISDQEANTAPGSNAGDTVNDFVTNVAEQTITVQLDRALVDGEQLLGSVDGGVTWAVVPVDVDYIDGFVGHWDVTLPAEGTDDIIFKVRAPNGAYLQVDGTDADYDVTALSHGYTLDQTAPDVGTLEFVSLSSDAKDPTREGATADAVTNQASGSITFSYSGDDLLAGERFQYSTDGGTTWLESVNGEGTTITVDTDYDTVTLDEVAFSTVSNLRLRVIDAAGNESTAGEDGGSYISQDITYDTAAPVWDEGSTTLSLDENVSGEDEGATLTGATASDADYNGVTYSLATGGEDDNALYTIDASTGALTRKTDANFENIDYAGLASETVVVTATDNAGNQSTKTFTINIQNVDEAGTLTISSGSEGYDYLQGSVLTANLSDIDGTASNVTYTWKVGDVVAQTGAGNTYTLGLADVGKQVSVSAAYTDPQGPNKTASSDSTYTVDALADQAITVAQAVLYADAINNTHAGEDYDHGDDAHVQGSFYVQDSAANVVAATKATLNKISADAGSTDFMGGEDTDGNEIVIDNGQGSANGTRHDITMAQMDALLNKGVVTSNDGALEAKDVYYDIYDFYTSVQAGQSTQQGQSIIANADSVTAYGNAVGQQIDMLAFDRDLIIYGRAGNDTIYTGTGDNLVTGGSGGDVVVGDKGSDFIFAGDLSNDVTGGAIDYAREMMAEVRAAIKDGDLSAIESFGAGFYGGEDIDGDTLSGGDGNDYLYGDGSHSSDPDGNGKADVLHGGNGDDVLMVVGGEDVLLDKAYGDAGDDILIHAGWGYAELRGGAGDDVYYVNNDGWNVTTVVEDVNAGSDLIVVDGDNWTLGANFENLTNIGGAAVLTGNELANVITGGAGADTLNDGGGSDTLITGGGADTVTLDVDYASDYVLYNVSTNLDDGIQRVTDAPASGVDSGYDTIGVISDAGQRDALVFKGFTAGTGRQLDGSGDSQSNAVLSVNDAISATASLLVVTDSEVSNSGDVSGGIAGALNSAFNLSSLKNGESMLFSVKASDIDGNVATTQWWVGLYTNLGTDDLALGDEIQIVGLVSSSGGQVDYDNFLQSVPDLAVP